MLCDKDGMAAKGRLLAVVWRLSGAQALVDEVARVIEHKLNPLALEIEPVLRPKPETPPEWRRR